MPRIFDNIDQQLLPALRETLELSSRAARPENGGAPRVRGEVNSIGFDDKLNRQVVYTVLNSSMYYQFFCIYTDTRHINPSDVKEFPLDLAAFSNDTKTKLNGLSAKLTKCLAAHSTQSRLIL